ncbi:hypothetical protein [Mucilaginibacter sp. BT774]|uniref:hypothetical protein n=1 Tax=Mucilaginibacter sp. BT774 TaxID=3062276 RepID=UPI00267752A8|nr:hypothetical protein [Mucilaginibacter sp. BT774]MDO3624662.1 hypothetical protein [Mucilaginibacter sp. BT774]
MKITLKCALLIGALILSTAAMAQQKAKKRTAYVQTGSPEYGNSTYTFNDNGGVLHEYVETNWKGDRYEMKLVGGKPTMLVVNGEKIAPADYGKYSEVISEIRAQIKRDREQAKRDQAQARVDQEQAKRDQEQAKRDQEQARSEQEEAKRDQQQAGKDQEQAKRDQEQAARDQEQAKRDQEQAKRDQVQAKYDQEQAKEDQRQVDLMMNDLVKDRIVPNMDSVRTIRMNEDELIVNGQKMSETVFSKYKRKYPRFAHGHSENGNFNGLSITR